MPNCIKPSSKSSHPSNAGIDSSSCSTNRVSHSQPPGENIQPHLLRLPQCGQVRRIDDPPPSASPVELPRGHGDEARSFLVWLQTIRSKEFPGSDVVLQMRSSRDRKHRLLGSSKRVTLHPRRTKFGFLIHACFLASISLGHHACCCLGEICSSAVSTVCLERA